eukprot:TRINITY_DN15799_c0_g1::TRINITY_DN15799_c0_g1_i1::g.25511::m.25511 TRINITY_DN15799_c0_g1::TRINITY_DN15799_c0_g1_i1::g.25511  ORF type:complete len:357 (-),score=70.18,sp/A5USH2/RS5_ROSS1/33.33/1e-17,Ribosomal_S5/PF00333.15/4.5e-12,Ribosomal_S5_C/PF03719.10/1.9e-07,Glyco_transf_29/PF00777.13/0.0029 TRINITY_DN15799_c0_g1_i1:414-1484(-)
MGEWDEHGVAIRPPEGARDFKIFFNQDEWFVRTFTVQRVSSTKPGGRVMGFRATAIVGNGKGLGGLGMGNSMDARDAVLRAFVDAQKNVVYVPTVNGRIVHPINQQYNASRVQVTPRRIGSGNRASRLASQVLDVLGIKDTAVNLHAHGHVNFNVLKAVFTALGQHQDVKWKARGMGKALVDISDHYDRERLDERYRRWRDKNLKQDMRREELFPCHPPSDSDLSRGEGDNRYSGAVGRWSRADIKEATSLRLLDGAAREQYWRGVERPIESLVRLLHGASMGKPQPASEPAPQLVDAASILEKWEAIQQPDELTMKKREQFSNALNSDANANVPKIMKLEIMKRYIHRERVAVKV